MNAVRNTNHLRGHLVAAAILCVVWVVGSLVPACAQAAGRSSKSISTILREPLPPEELQLSSSDAEWTITGLTFQYRIHKTTGTIAFLSVKSEGQDVIISARPLEIELDDRRVISELVSNQVLILTQNLHQIVLRSRGLLRAPAKNGSGIECTLTYTFFDDGVVVTSVKLTPLKDLPVSKNLRVQWEGKGLFSHYLHKRRDEHGDNAERGPLPESGKVVRFSTLTSCLQVFSPKAGLALFTDCGATHLSRPKLDTAEIEMTNREGQEPGVRLSQYLLQIAPGDKPYVLKADEDFTFRFGISVTPNRIAPRRRHDLRMFAWVGDAKFPYPTDQEIEVVAQHGYTLFQMHRLGTPGEPRPPKGELERVIKKVHELGMLFLWTENADLMYDSAPGVQELKAKGQFSLWQGFNYGGRYKASMDPYCDLVATCLASPNGLAEYRLATIKRMLERFAVDGIYLDDNLAYPNCTLWREHGHPRPVYDCLIELHQVNWERRQLMRSKCPHLVLASHNTRAIVLPVVCDFDAVLYGEGYSFGSLENYWDYYRPVDGMPAQGMIWPGGQDPVRCAAALAYNYDLLTGGGQYCYIDWRLFPNKFRYGAGVTGTEQLYVKTYNLAQYYFGLYESKVHYFANSAHLYATSTPLTYATIYHNQVWGDCLIAVANMGRELQKTALAFRADGLGITPDTDYQLFDIFQRTAVPLKGQALGEALGIVSLPAQSLRLFFLRPVPTKGAYHLWGGKRMSEEWDVNQRKLTVAIQGPAGLQETLFFGAVQQGIEQVKINGETKVFFFDPAQGLVHGEVTFSLSPLKVEVFCSPSAAHRLPERPVTVAPLARALNSTP